MGTEAAAGLERGFLLLGSRRSDDDKRKRRQQQPVEVKTTMTMATPPGKSSSNASGFKAGFLLDKNKTKKKHTTTPLPNVSVTSSLSFSSSVPPASSSPSNQAKPRPSKTNKGGELGFAKGFLVAASSKKTRTNPEAKTKKTNQIVNSSSSNNTENAFPQLNVPPQARPLINSIISSKELLSLEENLSGSFSKKKYVPPTSRPWSLVLDDHDEVDDDDRTTNPKPSKPLISVLSDDNDRAVEEPDSVLEAPPPPSSRPLSFLLGQGDNPSIGATTTDTTSDDFLFQEQSTTFYSTTSRRRDLVNDLSTTMEEAASSDPFVSGLDAAGPSPPVADAVLSTTVVDGSSSSSTKDDGLFWEFQRELARIQWQHDDVWENLVPKWSSLQVEWAWEWLLDPPPRAVPSTTTHEPLIQYLLGHRPCSVQCYLETTETPKDRSRALQLITWIQQFLLQSRTTSQDTKSAAASWHVWSETILPAITKIADQSRRTILAQEASDAGIVLLCRLSEDDALQSAGDVVDKTASPLLSWMQSLDRLLKAQLAWKRSKTKQQKSANKNQAHLVLLEDWIRVNENCKEQKMISNWRRQVAGVRLDDDDVCGWGGLCHLFGGKSVSIRKGTAEDLESACTMLGDTTTMDPIDQSILLRGLLCHLTKEKHLIDQGKMEQHILELVPRIADKTSCGDLVVTILKRIWSDSDGYPVDLRSHVGNGMPRSVEQLFKVLPEYPWDDDDPESSINLSQAMSSLVAECVLEVPNCENVVNTIIDKRGLDCQTVCVLLKISTIVKMRSAHNGELGTSTDHVDLANHIEERLVESVSTSSSVRQRLRKCAIFYEMNANQLKHLMPKLIGLYYDHCGKPETSSREIESLVESILAANVRSYAARGDLKLLVEGIANALTHPSSCFLAQKVPDSSHGLVLSQLCASWGRSLLVGPGYRDTAFADLVTAATLASSNEPSNVVLLALFGALFGEKFPPELRSVKRARFRTMLAIKQLVAFFNERMGEMKESDSLFRRLSPLLILRRIPREYFSIFRAEGDEGRDPGWLEEYSTLLDNIASLLQVSDTPKGAYAASPDERRLAAEVVGRSFAFGETAVKLRGASIFVNRPLSVFGRLCAPIFNALVEEFSRLQVEAVSISSIRQARSALYAACHSIPNTAGEDDEISYDQEYQMTARFVFFAIGIELDGLDEAVASELIQLQRGSIEFLALCLNCAFESREEAPPGTFTRIFESISSILQVGKTSHNGEWTSEPWTEVLTGEISIQVKTCLWNCLILVGKRCEESLNRFAAATLPWVVQSIVNASLNDDVVLLAAALQMTFVVVVRFEGQSAPKEVLVSSLYRRSLEIVAAPSGQTWKEIRLAALKLIMALATVDCPAVARLQDTYTVIKGLSTQDPDPDIRSLTAKILSIVHNK